MAREHLSGSEIRKLYLILYIEKLTMGETNVNVVIKHFNTSRMQKVIGGGGSYNPPQTNHLSISN